eukprot:136321-Amphidinium_carterae.1
MQCYCLCAHLFFRGDIHKATTTKLSNCDTKRQPTQWEGCASLQVRPRQTRIHAQPSKLRVGGMQSDKARNTSLSDCPL